MPNTDLSIGLQFIDKFTKPAQKAQQASEKLTDTMLRGQSELRSLGNDRSAIKRFADLSRAVATTNEKFVEAQREVKTLKNKMNEVRSEGGKITEKMRSEFTKANVTAAKLSQRHIEQRKELGKLRVKLKTAGVDTRNLASEQKRLGDRYAEVTKRMKSLALQTEKNAAINKRFDNSLQKAANASLVGHGLSSVGNTAFGLLSRPTDQFRSVERSKGDLQALGIKDTDAILNKGRELSGKFAYIDTASFGAAAYNTKSAISSLSDNEVAEATAQAAITAKATKSAVDEMTSLFGTGFGIFKNTQFSDASNSEFLSRFGATITAAVQEFKTTGSEMKQSIQSMGPGLSNVGISMSEQVAALGLLQQTMEAGEAGTALKSVGAKAAQAQERFDKAGINVQVLDESGNLRSLADLMQSLQDVFGEQLSSKEEFQINQAFGSEEAVKFFGTLWGQQDRLRQADEKLKSAGDGAEAYTESVAKAIDANNGDSRYQLFTQRMQIVSERFGRAMLPVMEAILPLAEAAGAWVGTFVETHPQIASSAFGVIAGLGAFGLVMGPVVTGFGGLIATGAFLNKSFKKLSLWAEAISKNGSGIGGDGGIGDGNGKSKKGGRGKWGRLKSAGKWGGRLLGGAGAILSLASIGSTLTDDDLSTGDKAKSVTEDVGGIGGAALGAAIGSAILPGIGTIIGGGIGALAGSWGTSLFSDSVAKAFDNENESDRSPSKLASAANTFKNIDAGSNARKVIAGVGVASAVTAGSVAAPISVSKQPQINDNSQYTISINLNGLEAKNKDELTELIGEAIEAKLRDVQRRKNLNQGAILYDAS